MGYATGIFFSLLAATAASAQSGPLGYWRGDDGTAPTTAADSSGNGRNGTYTAGATTSPSVNTLLFNNASSMSFDGTNDFVNVGTFPWATGGPVSIAFWNFVPTGGVQNSSAFTVGAQDNANRFHAHAPWGDGNLYWDYGDIGGTGRISTSYAAYVNAWTHVALVSEGNGGAFKAIYLNGALAVSAASSDGPDMALNGVQIGSWNALFHRGLIDEFRIFDRVLSAAEIGTLAGLTPLAAPTLSGTALFDRVDLAWTAVAGASSYTVLRGPSATGPWTSLATGLAGLSYSDTGVVSGTTYFYVVYAVGLVDGPSSSPPLQMAVPFPPPRTNDHDEGLVGDKCACGTAAPASGLGWMPLLPLLWILRRRR